MFARVRRHEIPKLRFFLIHILLVWTGLAVAMTVTETLLFSGLGVAYLPMALLCTSLFTLVASLGYTALLSYWSSYRLMVTTLASSSALLVVAFAGLQSGASWLALPLFAFFGATFSLLSTQTFGLASECIDTFACKRLFPLLTVGATCGELCGGLLVAHWGCQIEPCVWLLVWSATWLMALVWLRLNRPRLEEWRVAPPGRKRAQPIRPVLKYIANAPMARALVLLGVGMVLCQATSQYLFSQVFARNYPQSQRLAVFLGTLVAVTNVAELFIASMVTPRLVSVLGVARAGWLHPLSMLTGLVLLTGSFTLVPAVMLWVSRRTLQDSLAGPVRNLLYNAIPLRLRGHLRAFLDGVVVSGAQGFTALTLLGLQRVLKPEQICYVGLFLALIYLSGAASAGRNYLRTLVGELEAEGLRLSESGPLRGATRPAWRLKEQSLTALQEGLEGLHSQLDHRLEAVEALAHHPDPLALGILAQALASDQVQVRRCAAERLGRLGDSGVQAAQGYLHSDQSKTVEAALQAVGCGQTAWGRSLLHSELHRRVHEAGLAWLAAHSLQGTGLEERFLAQALMQEVQRHTHLAFQAMRWLEGEELVETVRLAVAAHGGRRASALEVLSNLGDRQVSQLFVTLLEPAADEDRKELLKSLLKNRPELTDVVKWALHSQDPWVRWAALQAYGQVSPASRRKMEHLLALRACLPFTVLEFDALEELRGELLEERYARPTTLWKEGQTLAKGYLLLEGQLPQGAQTFYGGVELVGEFPAREDLASRGPVRLLAVRQSVLQAAVQRTPVLGLGLFQWLSREIRRSESKVAAS